MDKIAFKVPGYELAQCIMPKEHFAVLRSDLWKLNSSSYLRGK
jgi:hypothetical protein